ncbi:MAG: M16 family metallopeptidase, partial [Nitrospiria bacterium]
LAMSLWLSVPVKCWSEELSSRVVRHEFKNGLVLLMVERHTSPTISFNITYKAGSVDEQTGMTGIAHLYEHMAFKGTEKIGTKNYKLEKPVLDKMEKVFLQFKAERALGDRADSSKMKKLEKDLEALEKKGETFAIPNEIGEIYGRNGAVGFNASTGKDTTNYVVSLPSNRLSLWIALESDRMTHPVLREFYKEKQVVLEERRLRSENSPSGKLYEALLRTAFWVHPYGLPGIGWTQDVQSLSASQTKDFFKTYYGVNNIVIAIVGDIRPEQVVREMEKTFGHIPAPSLPPPVSLVEPPQEGERRVYVEYDANPILYMAFHKPGVDHPVLMIFEMIDSLLSDGRTSRLYKHLVTQKQIALTVGTDSDTPGSKYPNLFLVSAAPRAPHSLEELEKAIDTELDLLKKEPVTSFEFQKMINQFDGNLVRSLESNSGLAGQLAYYEAVTGDWKYILKLRRKMERVKPEDIIRVAREYFVDKNKIVATLNKPGISVKAP